MCAAGTYVNATGATVCLNCDAGYTSSKMKDRCSPCEEGTFSVGDGSTCQPCADATECPCVAIPGPCFTVKIHLFVVGALFKFELPAFSTCVVNQTDMNTVSCVITR